MPQRQDVTDSRSGSRALSLPVSVYLLACSSLFSDISTEMLYPILPTFLTRTLHADGTIVGLIDGFAQAVQNLAQGFSGALSDWSRRHKAVALVGYALSAIAKPLMGLASIWPGVFAARLLDRFGAGSRSAPRDAMIAASVEPADRGRAFGLEGLGDNAGAFLGPLIAVLLLRIAGVGIRSVFYWAILPGALAFALVTLVREHAVRTPRAGAGAGVAHAVPSTRHFPRVYRRYLLAAALFNLGNSSNAFLILRTQEAGASLSLTILIYAGYNLVAALISYPAGSLSDRWGRRALLLAAYIVFLGAYLGFALTTRIAVLAPLFVLYGLYQGIYRAAGRALAVDVAPAGRRASAIGWYSATVGALQLCASLVAGLLWDRIDHAAVFYLGAASALTGVIALWICVPARLRGN